MELCLFSSSKPRLKEKKALDKHWAESDQGSFYQQERWLRRSFPRIFLWFSASLSTWSAFQEIFITNYCNCYMTYGLKCVVPENIHIPPTEGIFHMTPLPAGFSKNGPQTIPLPRSGNSNFFLHPLEIFLFLD